MNIREDNTIGVIGLSVMGANIAMNIADHGFSVSVYNRSKEKTEDVIKIYAKENMIPFFDLKKFIESLEKPRKILLMVKAGDAVDALLSQLTPLLMEGDIIIDGGNSFFKDTIRREQQLKEQGLFFVGMGVSGGEEGARRGPSLMPGGASQAWESLEPILKSISAKDFHNGDCVIHIGENGSGHYVKMIHNGIEYIDMQLIAETYWIMKEILQMPNEKIAETFEQWNKGRLNSFLIEITTKILRTKNENGEYVLDTILDTAGSKGTGKWTSEEALELGTPSFGFIVAVLARYASAHKKKRIILSKTFKKDGIEMTDISLDQLEEALYVSKILAYTQGYELLVEAGKTYGWKLDLKEISRIWEGGCIIRAHFLEELEKAFLEDDTETSVILASAFKQTILSGMASLRHIAQKSIACALPIPAFLSGITYYDNITSEKVSANMIQAQRDFFGSHTFQKEVDGEYTHYKWEA